MFQLDGKRVLLITPYFFGYELEIFAELKRRGALVDILPDRPFTSPFLKAVTRFRRELILDMADHYFLNAIEKLGRTRYDYILVIQGEAISTDLLTKLRSSFPSAKSILYMWDSFDNKKSLIPNIKHFDKCITFDPHDANRYDLKFRPLFFSPGFQLELSPKVAPVYDISFIGTAHSDRYKIVSQISAGLPSLTQHYWYLFLQAPWVFWLRKIGDSNFRGATKNEFNFNALAKSEVQNVFLKSASILDIEHPAQTGLTMRTFESLGASKKLITTNKYIRDYDFFDENNIMVIDRSKTIQIPKSFFDTPYTPPSKELYASYSIANWLEDMLELKPFKFN
jgi:hypothetical protein